MGMCLDWIRIGSYLSPLCLLGVFLDGFGRMRQVEEGWNVNHKAKSSCLIYAPVRIYVSIRPGFLHNDSGFSTIVWSMQPRTSNKSSFYRLSSKKIGESN